MALLGAGADAASGAVLGRAGGVIRRGLKTPAGEMIEEGVEQALPPAPERLQLPGKTEGQLADGAAELAAAARTDELARAAQAPTPAARSAQEALVAREAQRKGAREVRAAQVLTPEQERVLQNVDEAVAAQAKVDPASTIIVPGGAEQSAQRSAARRIMEELFTPDVDPSALHSFGVHVLPPLLKQAAGGAVLGAGAGAAFSTADDRAEAMKTLALIGMTGGMIGSAHKSLDRHSKWYQRYMSAGGKLVGATKGLNRRLFRDVQGLVARHDGEMAAADRIISAEFKNLTRAADNLYAGEKITAGGVGPFAKMPPRVLQDIKDFANHADASVREAALDRLPTEIRTPLSTLRRTTDKMSRILVDQGVVEGGMAVRFNENMGFYLHRSYKRFDFPDYGKNPAKYVGGEAEWQKITNRFKTWYRSSVNDLPEEEMDDIIQSLISSSDTKNMIELFSKPAFSSMARSVLKERKAIPIELRQLWGEHEDIGVRFAKSLTGQMQLLATHRFYRDMSRLGDNTLFKNAPTGEFQVQFGQNFGKLAGKYTTPEMKEAFEAHMGREAMSNMQRIVLGVMGASKIGKTVLSPKTHIRNVLGNPGFALRSGFFYEAEAIKQLPRAARVTRDVMLRRTREDHAYYNRLGNLGVVGQSARGEEIRDMLKYMWDGSLDPTAENMLKGRVRKWADVARMSADKLSRLYAAEDDVFKVFAFEVERGRLAAKKPNMSSVDLDKRTAQIVRDTWPTYSMTPEVIKKMSRVGGFMSWPSEIIRTLAGTVRIAKEEMADPDLARQGAMRLAGLASAAGVAPAISRVTRLLHGVSKEQDDATRNNTAEWWEDSFYGYLGPYEDGKAPVWYISASDAHAPVNQIFASAFGGGGVGQRLKGSAKTAAGTLPLASPLTAALSSAIGETAKYPYRDRGEIWRAAAYDALMPGVVDQVGRLASGRTARFHSPLDVRLEASGMVLGVTARPMDIKSSLEYGLRSIQQEIYSVDDKVQRARFLGQREGVPQVDAVTHRFQGVLPGLGGADRFARMEEGVVSDIWDRGGIYERAGQLVRDALVSGIAEDEVKATLVESLPDDVALKVWDYAAFLGGYRERPTREQYR